jgi:hypothetical protein
MEDMITMASSAPPVARPLPIERLLPSKRLKGVRTDERSLARRIELIWGLLFINVATFVPHVSVIPIPGSVGKGITQLALQIALLMAIGINRRLFVRPNLFLFLVTLLPLEAFLTLITAQHFTGTAYRSVRYAEFVGTLWLLSPYWGRRDYLILRAHLKVMTLILVSVVIGLVIAPGRALAGGRLGGAIWPIPATQVAHYCMVTLGIVVVSWFCGLRSGRSTLLYSLPVVAIMLLTHTRTALVGGIAGLIVGGVSVAFVNHRVRQAFITTAAICAIGFLSASSLIISFMTRGESTTQLTNLTGRTNFWIALENAPRDKFEEIFGFGMSNGTFNGTPVDSNWMLSYQDQGIFGITVCALILLVLIIWCIFENRNFSRAMALFLVIYCLIASFTEVGFTNASPYMLDITVAASLMVNAPLARRRTPAAGRGLVHPGWDVPSEAVQP